jgi:AIR synthase-related protein
MKMESGSLGPLASALRARVEIDFKRDIQLAARMFGRETRSAWIPGGGAILNGDDAAALPCEAGGYVLLAAEGMRAELVAADPWFAGFASVLTNVNDIAAMGGRPWAVVDVLFLGGDDADSALVLEGMAAASAAYGVPVVGGHTTRVAGATMLSVAVVGRATRIISGAGARPGQTVVVAVDLGGSFRDGGSNFDAATSAPIAALRARVGLLSELAEDDLVRAGKDISMAGLCGTLLMMLEASGCGARLDLEALPAPPGCSALRWLTAFPSFGFVLAVDPEAVAAVCARFDAVGVVAAAVGKVTQGTTLELACGSERAVYWDAKESEDGPLTGFGGGGS